MQTSPDTAKTLAHLDANFDRSRARWFEFLRIPSVSAQPVHAADCRTAAEWVRGQIEAMGFTAALHDTPGHPVVLGHHPGPDAEPGAPHLLFYGHYDVQPAEPFELWHTPPFEPTSVQGQHGEQVFARGAVDDKGQVCMWLEALRAWHDVHGTLPVRVTVLVEGEEEVGSPSLETFLADHADQLKADMAVISDTGMWDIDTPALTTRLRGIVAAEVTLHAASRDLHSGVYGGSALNPINALTEVLGGLKDADGCIQIPGFYDGVKDVPPSLAAQWQSLGFDEGAFLGDVGLQVPSGERGRAPLDRMWARPTADINGIWGGYQGPGSKTVIASHAGAKITFRLVPGQDPQKIADGFRAFVARRTPPGARAEVKISARGGSPGIEISSDNRFVTAAQAVLAEEYGRPAVLIGSGGSIPVVEQMRRLLGLDSLLMGFGLDDDQVHSPNEKFDVRCFRGGMRAHARLLGHLGQT